MTSLTKQPSPTPLEETGPPTSSDEKPKHPRWRHATILASAFTINFTACGLLFSSGVYQSLYETLSAHPDTPFTSASPASISLISTLAISLMTLGAPYAVSWTKRRGPRPVVCAGAALFGTAHVLASFGTALWHFQLAQGLLVGVGTCLSFMPATAVAPTWFDRRRGLAVGFVSAGTGVGGLVWAPAVAAGVERLGYRDTLRLTGALGAGLIGVAGCALAWEPEMGARLRGEREEEEEEGKRKTTTKVAALCRIPLPPWEMVRQRRFVAQALAAALQSAAYYTPVVFTVAYAKTLGYDDRAGANITAVSNACNAVGKIAVGFLADRIGRLNALVLTTFVSAAATVALWLPSTVLGTAGGARELFVAFTVVYGLSASAFVSLFAPALVELFGVRELPRVAGVMYMAQGAAALVGIPVAGVLVRGQNYTWVAVLVSGLLFAATAAVACVRIEVMLGRAGGKWRWMWVL